MQIIIITKDQRQYIPEFAYQLDSQLPDIKRLFVIDKDTDESKLVLKALHENFIEHTETSGFCAGKCRDIGLNTFGIDDTIFFDGDRIPHGLGLEIVGKALEYDACLMKVENDFRKYFTIDFIKHPKIGIYRNDFFSCGLLIKKELINKIRILQNGRLFNDIFDGIWGEEDRYLGDVIHTLKGSVGLFPNSCYVEGGFNSTFDQNTYRQQCLKRAALYKG